MVRERSPIFKEPEERRPAVKDIAAKDVETKDAETKDAEMKDIGVKDVAALVVAAGAAAVVAKFTWWGAKGLWNLIPNAKGPVEKESIQQVPVEKSSVSKESISKNPTHQSPATRDPRVKIPAYKSPTTKEPRQKDPTSKAPIHRRSGPLLPQVKKRPDTQEEEAKAQAREYLVCMKDDELAIREEGDAIHEMWNTLPNNDMKSLIPQRRTDHPRTTSLQADILLRACSGLNNAALIGVLNLLGRNDNEISAIRARSSKSEIPQSVLVDIVNADKWILQMREVHKTLRSRKHDDERIKIAILDTGFDFGLLKEKNAIVPPPGAGIIEGKNFLDHHSSGSGHACDNCDAACMLDEVGHGTHLTGLLLKLAPEAEIYVGKVTATEDGLQPGSIVQAIEFACNTWKVDVICLSLGFAKSEPDNVRSAIEKACTRGKLFFAAAGVRSDGQVAFPARTDSVTAIYSCHDRGPSDFNPPTSPRLPTDRYCFPGEGVKSLWPIRLLGARPEAINEMVYEGVGTSQATALATALGACILELLRQYRHDSEDGVDNEPWVDLDFSNIQKPFGIQRVFRFLSPTEEGPFLVRPQKELHVRNISDRQALIRQRTHIVEVLHHALCTFQS